MTAQEQIDRAREVLAVEIDGLRKVGDSLDATFAATVDLFLKTTAAGGIVIVTGVGKNLHVAEKLSATFASTGTRSFVLNPVQAMHGDLGMTSAADVLLALSFSGESDEIVRLIPPIRRHGLKVVAVTGNAESTLARLADIHLAVPCGKEACPFGMAPTNSTTATMALGDALAMVLVEARHYSLAEYAGNHPAGAIGRALVLRAADIMRTGAGCAVVPPTATLLEAIMAMTAAKCGAAIVADGERRLLGILTDGDFRRVISAGRSGAELGDAVSAHMTASPVFVRDDAYAVELLKVFESRRIDDLPVCDREGRVVGLVDIQDLPKMKVF